MTKEKQCDILELATETDTTKTNKKRERLHMKNTYELNTVYDSRKSFYGKARVEETETAKHLISYTTRVATIENDKATVNGTYSPTTLRHIKEFLKQNGFKADTKGQIEELYMA